MAAPTLWNQLPISIISFENIDTFRNKKGKTYLFVIVFQPQSFGGSKFQ
jgi:hypothetical protein